jgi:hypothetical protein
MAEHWPRSRGRSTRGRRRRRARTRRPRCAQPRGSAPPRRWRTRGRGVGRNSAEAFEAAYPLGTEHAESTERGKVTAGVELVAAAANLSELKAERGQLGDIVVELVDAALDRLQLVETGRFVGVIRSAERVEVEILAELGHRAQGDEVAAHVGDTVAGLGLQRPRAVRVMALQRRWRRGRGRHRSSSGMASSSGITAWAARDCHELSACWSNCQRPSQSTSTRPPSSASAMSTGASSASWRRVS